MSITTPPWNTETAILPTLLDHVFTQMELMDQQIERITSSDSLVAQTEGSAESSAMGSVTNQESKLSFSLHVPEFGPDELNVKIDGRTLTVEGKQEISEGSNYTSRSFLRRWTLPDDVDVDQIRSTFTENAKLIIEVPTSKPTVTARTVPIRMTINGQ